MGSNQKLNIIEWNDKLVNNNLVSFMEKSVFQVPHFLRKNFFDVAEEKVGTRNRARVSDLVTLGTRHRETKLSQIGTAAWQRGKSFPVTMGGNGEAHLESAGTLGVGVALLHPLKMVESCPVLPGQHSWPGKVMMQFLIVPLQILAIALFWHVCFGTRFWLVFLSVWGVLRIRLFPRWRDTACAGTSSPERPTVGPWTVSEASGLVCAFEGGIGEGQVEVSYSYL